MSLFLAEIAAVAGLLGAPSAPGDPSPRVVPESPATVPSDTLGGAWAASDSLTVPLFIFDPVVVTVTRRREARLRAPASVTVIDTTRIWETVRSSPVELVRTVPGVDFASKGLNQHTFAVRGDRSVNSTALLMLTDYRYAAVPSLGFNIPYLLSPAADDIERIEVVRGPGAALYGPDSDKGVLHILTRSPFDSRGTRVSAAGGERSAAQIGFRHASVLGDHWGVKISGEYFRGDDWTGIDPAEAAARAKAIAGGASPDTLRIGNRDHGNERAAGEARVDWRSGGGSNAVLTAGTAQALNLVDYTATSGAIQVRDWKSSYLQLRAARGKLFGNAFLNASDAGDSYILRTGDRIVDESRVWGAQLQHGRDAGPDGRYRFLYGVDLRTTQPRTGGTIHGRNEENDTVTELGGYLHTSVDMTDRMEAVAALRADYHDRLGDLVLSPRLGLVYRPEDGHTVRLVYNRAFNSPSSTELFIDLEQQRVGPFGIRLRGIPGGGYTFSRECDGGPCMWVPDLSGGSPVRLAADATVTWPAIVALLQQQGVDLSGVPPPDGDQVGTVLAALDLESETFSPVSENFLAGYDPLKRTVSGTIEMGYKGVLGKRASIQADVYYWHQKDPVGDFFVATPNVFYDGTELAAYLAGYMSGSTADSLAAIIAGIPVGTVSPDQAGASTDLLVLSKQGGAYDNLGADAAVEIQVNRRVWTALSYSWILDNAYADVDVLGNVVLGVPRNKGALTVGYRDTRGGRSASLCLRAVESFRVVNGVYRGRVGAYAALDLDLQARVRSRPQVTLTLTVTNVLDHRHAEFVGTPELGRLAVGRITTAF
jgi:iron complex outermembrane receptor protein